MAELIFILGGVLWLYAARAHQLMNLQYNSDTPRIVRTWVNTYLHIGTTYGIFLVVALAIYSFWVFHWSVPLLGFLVGSMIAGLSYGYTQKYADGLQYVLAIPFVPIGFSMMVIGLFLL